MEQPVIDPANLQVLDPVFWSMLLAIATPGLTALIVKYQASSAWKSAVAVGISVAEAAALVWKTADAAGQPVNWKILVLAIATAVTAQRVAFTQVYRPAGIPEKLPQGGLVG